MDDVRDIFDKAIVASKATIDRLLLDIFSSGEYRCYSSYILPETEDIIKKYISEHSRAPGTFGSIYSSHPLSVFKDALNYNMKIAVFVNGIIILTISPEDGKEYWILFVEDLLARKHNYPDGYVNISDNMREVLEGGVL